MCTIGKNPTFPLVQGHVWELSHVNGTGSYMCFIVWFTLHIYKLGNHNVFYTVLKMATKRKKKFNSKATSFMA